MNNYREKAFSLLEIVIATALLGVVIISVCSVFVKGFGAIKKGQKNMSALQMADKKMDEVMNVDLTDPLYIHSKNLCTNIEGYDPVSIKPSDPDISWNIDGNKEIKGSERISGVDYKFTINIESYKTGLKKISVKINWLDIELHNNKYLELNSYLSRKNFDL